MTNLDEVLTFSEAAEKWGLADGKSIRKAVERHRFEPYEIKKSGNVWLTTYDAMYRVFGAPRSHPMTIYYFDFYEDTMRGKVSELFKKAEEEIKKGEMVSIVESRERPDRIFCILKSMEEMEGLKRRLRYYLEFDDVFQDKEEKPYEKKNVGM